MPLKVFKDYEFKHCECEDGAVHTGDAGTECGMKWKEPEWKQRDRCGFYCEKGRCRIEIVRPTLEEWEEHKDDYMGRWFFNAPITEISTICLSDIVLEYGIDPDKPEAARIKHLQTGIFIDYDPNTDDELFSVLERLISEVAKKVLPSSSTVYIPLENKCERNLEL